MPVRQEQTDAEELRGRLRAARSVFVLTGAGVSAALLLVAVGKGSGVAARAVGGAVVAVGCRETGVAAAPF